LKTGRNTLKTERALGDTGTKYTKRRGVNIRLTLFFSVLAFWSSKATKKDQNTTTSVLYKMSKMRKLKVNPIQPMRLIVPKRSPTEKK
tara:strand:- start:76 stop:339 length:264 start_codon:yes stop_codon:yes gene_type:complete